jgi:hypothetical protein
MSSSEAKLCVNVLSKPDNLLEMANSISNYRGTVDCGKEHEVFPQFVNMDEARKKTLQVSTELINHQKFQKVVGLLCGCSLDLADFYAGKVGFCNVGEEPKDCFNSVILFSAKKGRSLGQIFDDGGRVTESNHSEFGTWATHKFDDNDYILFNREVDKKRIDAFWEEHHDDNP